MRSKNLCAVVVALALVAIGLSMVFIYTRSSPEIEGIRTSTFRPEGEMSPVLAVDMHGKDLKDYSGYLTYALYDLESDEKHVLDICGRLERITPTTAVLKDHTGKYYGTLTIVDDSAVVVTSKGNTYELKYCLDDRMIDQDFSSWFKYYGSNVR